MLYPDIEAETSCLALAAARAGSLESEATRRGTAQCGMILRMATPPFGDTARIESPELATSRFRPDIEGLRAIAVLLVLLWHAGVPFLPGGFIGVDVFFVVSGFLMTGILHRELVMRQRISVLKFYARRARRLVPAGTVVLVVTAFATWAVLPATRWWDVGLDIGAAGAYVLNWLLAATSVDYLAQDAAASPVQHFWSLSVEEQYYFAWPLILVVAAWYIRRSGATATACALGILGLAFVGSLAWSIYATNVQPGVAYFATTTRVWELALGGIVALSAQRFAQVSRQVSTALGWAALAAILATAVLLTTDVPFPGSVALVPTVATAVVLAVGNRGGVATAMNNPPTQAIGRLSYSLYLWHWPILVIGGYLITDGIASLSVPAGISLIILSVIPAALSYRFVECPFRDSTRLREVPSRSVGVAVAGIVIALVLAACLTGGAKLAQHFAPEPQFTSDDSQITFGAAVIGSPGYDQVVNHEISPSPLLAGADNPPVYARGCQQPQSSSEPVACEFGDPASPITVALVGDSHAAHWVDALAYVADQRGWRLLTYTKSSCALVDAPVLYRGAPAPKCTEWNGNVQAELAKVKPSAVFVSNINYRLQSAGEDDNERELTAAMARSWTALAATGTQVYVLRDTPASKFNPTDCLAGHLDEPQVCATPRDEAFGNRGLAQLDAAAISPVTVIDVTASVCPSDPCSPVIGGVMVYRDKTHMTATYSRSLGPVLDRAAPAIGPRN